MNKSMLAGIGIGVAAALGVAAVASLNVFERGPQYAQVVSATPIKETVKTPRQECRNVTVTHRRPVQDENRITGSVVAVKMSPLLWGRWVVDMPVTRSRALSRKAILTRLRNSVVKRCMTSQKKCSVMM